MRDLNFLLSLTANSESFNNEIEKSFGFILFEMKEQDVVPSLDLLLEMKQALAVPFMLENYALSNKHLDEMKSWLNINKDVSSDGELNNALNVNSYSPVLVAKLLLNYKKINITDDMDFNFLSDVMREIGDKDYIFQSGLHEDFLSKCLERGLERKQLTQRNAFNLIKKMKLLSSSEYPFLEKACSKYESQYNYNLVKDWADDENMFFNVHQTPFMSFDKDNKETVHLMAKVFERSVSSGDFANYKDVMLYGNGYPHVFQDKLNEVFANISKEDLKVLFLNKLPILWSVDDIKTPEVKNILIDLLSKNDELDTSFKCLFKKDLFDEVFTEDLIHELSKNYSLSSLSPVFTEDLSHHLSKKYNLNYIKEDDSRFYALLANFKILSHILKNDIPQMNNNVDNMYLKGVGRILKFILESEISKTKSSGFSELFLDEIIKNPKLLRYELYSNLGFDLKSSMDNASLYEDDKKSLANKIMEYLWENPTFDGFFILAEATLDEDVKLAFLNKLHPYDISLIKEIAPSESILNAQGDLSAEKASFDTCFLYRGSASDLILNVLEVISLNGFLENSKVKDLLLTSPNQVIAGESFIKMNTLSKGEQSLISFAQEYQNKFPYFMKNTPSMNKLINTVPGLATKLNRLPAGISYQKIKSGIMEFKDKSQSLFLEKLPVEVKALFYEDCIKKGEWLIIDESLKGNKSVSLDYLMFKRRLFRLEPDVFSSLYANTEVSTLPFILEVCESNLGEKHIELILDLYRGNNYTNLNLLNKFYKNEETAKIVKELILNRYCEFILYPSVKLNKCGVNESEALTALNSLLVSADLNVFKNSISKSLSGSYFLTDFNFNKEQVSSIIDTLKDLDLEKRVCAFHVLKSDFSLFIKDKLISNNKEEKIPNGKIVYSPFADIFPEFFDKSLLDGKFKELIKYGIKNDLEIMEDLNSIFKRDFCMENSPLFEDNSLFNNLKLSVLELMIKEAIENKDFNSLLSIKSPFKMLPKIKIKDIVSIDEDYLWELLENLKSHSNTLLGSDNFSFLMKELADVVVSGVLNNEYSDKTINKLSFHVNMMNFINNYVEGFNVEESLKQFLSESNLGECLESHKKHEMLKKILNFNGEFKDTDSSESFKI